MRPARRAACGGTRSWRTVSAVVAVSRWGVAGGILGDGGRAQRQVAAVDVEHAGAGQDVEQLGGVGVLVGRHLGAGVELDLGDLGRDLARAEVEQGRDRAAGGGAGGGRRRAGGARGRGRGAAGCRWDWAARRPGPRPRARRGPGRRRSAAAAPAGRGGLVPAALADVGDVERRRPWSAGRAGRRPRRRSGRSRPRRGSARPSGRRAPGSRSTSIIEAAAAPVFLASSTTWRCAPCTPAGATRRRSIVFWPWGAVKANGSWMAWPAMTPGQW